MADSRRLSLLDKLIFESVDSIDFETFITESRTVRDMEANVSGISNTSDVTLCLPYLCFLSQKLSDEQSNCPADALEASRAKSTWSFLNPLENVKALKRFIKKITESQRIFSYLYQDIKKLVESVRAELGRRSELQSSSQANHTVGDNESGRHPFEEGTDAKRVMLVAADLISTLPISSTSALANEEYAEEAGTIAALLYLVDPSITPLRVFFSKISLLPTFNVIATMFVYNLPDRFFEICSVLVSGFCEGNQKYKEFVFSLIPQGELVSRQIREEVEKFSLSSGTMALILATTLESDNDTVRYFYGRVRNDLSFLRTLSSIGGLSLVRDALLMHIARREELYYGLALLCCLRTVERGTNEHETNVVVDIVNDSSSSQQIHDMLLFYFLIFPEAINLVAKKSDVVHSIITHCSPEILLQVVSSLRVNSILTIESTISGLLCVPVNLNISSSFAIFRDILSKEFISPTFCDDFLHTLPIVMHLNHFSVTQIPKCVSAIIVSGIAKERNVDLSSYIWEQAKQCTKPVKGDFVETVRLYAKQLDPCNGTKITSIPQDRIVALLNGKLDQSCVCPTTTKLIILEYILARSSEFDQVNPPWLLHSTLFFSCIKERIFNYNKCKSKESECITAAFTSQLMGQLAMRYPQLFDPEHELELTSLRRERVIWRTLPTSFSVEELMNPEFVCRCFSRVRELPEQVYLALLAIRPNKSTLPFISAMLPLIIGNVVIEEQWLRVWKEEYESWPARVAEITLIAFSVWTERQRDFTPNEFLTRATEKMNDSACNVVANAYTDPLNILRLDKCFLTNVRGIDVILELLSYFLTASRKNLFVQIQNQPSDKKTLTDIIFYQDTIALQILIEWVLLIENETDDLPTIIQIRKKIFTFLHSTFCKNMSLLQKIHQQGYPIAAIPLLVKGVPSFHLCSTFLKELLLDQNSDYQSLLFAFHLTANIVREYPIKSNIDISKIAVEQFDSVIMCTEQTSMEIDREKSISRIEFICKALPAMVMMAKAFKVIAIDLLQILTKFIALLTKHRREGDPLNDELYETSTKALHKIADVVSEL